MTEDSKSNRIRVSGKTIGEALAAVGVIASMIFVGLEIRQSNIQARAAAYQAIGIATAQYHSGLNERVNRLLTEANFADVLERWTLADWEAYYRAQVAGLRMVETVQLQVEQGLLDEDAMSRLGYDLSGHHVALDTPAFRCVWDDLRGFVGESLRGLIESSREMGQCPVDLEALRAATVRGGGESPPHAPVSRDDA